MHLHGSIVALITPMFDDGSINFPALRQLVDWHIAQGTTAIVAVGTTGESATLTDDEHLETVRVILEQVAGRIPVIAGTGSASTAKAVLLTEKMAGLRVDATLCVTPYYLRPTQEGLYQHYKAVAAASSVPVILYNVPGRTGCDLTSSTVARLSELPNIIGIKEASGNLDRLAELQAAIARPDFLYFAGDDSKACEFTLRNGHGVISATANVAPALMAKMCALAEHKDSDEARRLDAILSPLFETLFIEPNPTASKWACAKLFGFAPAIRLPLLPLTEKSQSAVHQAMHSAGLV